MSHMMEAMGPGRFERYVEKEGSNGHTGGFGMGLVGLVAGGLLGAALLWRNNHGGHCGIPAVTGYGAYPVANVTPSSNACCVTASEASLTASRIADAIGGGEIKAAIIERTQNAVDTLRVNANQDASEARANFKEVFAAFCCTAKLVSETAALTDAKINCLGERVTKLQCVTDGIAGGVGKLLAENELNIRNRLCIAESKAAGCDAREIDSIRDNVRLIVEKFLLVPPVTPPSLV